MPELVERGACKRQSDEAQAREDELYQEIGKLKMELEWLKKNLPASTSERCRMIDSNDPKLSIRRQCELLGISRSSYYHEPAGESAENLALMRVIDEQHLRCPFFGRRQMTMWLRLQGHQVNEKRVRRLMSLMGLEAVFPGRTTTIPNREHRVYPYLLRGVEVVRPNQVWSADITYIPMSQGFMYLVAVIDWYSRAN